VTIRMNELAADPLELMSAQFEAIERVIKSGWYVLGNEVDRFESRWANRCGTEHAIGVANGLDAIEISLRCLGISTGDEVITTPMTAFASVLAILRAGATPVLADIDICTGLLDVESVLRCIGARTKALLLVHLYGNLGNMDRWQHIAAEHGIELIEDCAQAHGAQWHGKTAGSFGRLGAYSFYPTKNLGALGDGGAIVTSDAGLADRARVLRNYGQTQRYIHDVIGMNSRLDEIQAAVLSTRLDWLDRFTARRRAIANIYYSRIINPLVRVLAVPVFAEAHVHHLFVLLTDERQELSAQLKSRGVESFSHYPVPIHRQRPCEGIRRDPNGLDNAEAFAASCLSIPCHPNLTDDDVQRVVEAVNDFRQ
jgi:dTDP-4-amino-4,6-dideoxygalactose transaminase